MKRVTPATVAEVVISTASDDDAKRIAAVLEALGYSVKRALTESVDPQRLNAAADRLVDRHKLTERERDILRLVLAGVTSKKIATSLDVSRHTVKWHMHNIFVKTNTPTREKLLRLALQLIGD
jgi:DNA-binding CsgD family transcriptional regulator